jgi:ribosomal protein S18 acetylase RimI-like enzyme
MWRILDHAHSPPAVVPALVRAAKPGDAKRISAVRRASWRDTYSGLLPDHALTRAIGRRSPRWWKTAIQRGDTVLVTEISGTLAGYVTLGPNRVCQLPYEGEIYELYLGREWKRMGLGRRLFTAARESLARRGLKGLVLWALAENTRACAFYERIGGKTVAEGDTRYGPKTMRMIAFAWD